MGAVDRVVCACACAPSPSPASRDDKPAAPLDVTLSATDLGGGALELRLDATPRVNAARLVLALGGARREVPAAPAGVTQHLVARGAADARGSSS